MRKQEFLAVFGLLLSSVPGWMAEPNQAQEQALAAIKKAGGEITRDESSPARPLVKVTFGCHSKVTDAEFAHLASLPELRELVVIGHGVTDQGLESLKRLTQLKSLIVVHAKITDKGLVHLKEMKSLRKVHIRFTGVTEAGSKELAKALPNASVTWKP